MKSRSLLRKKVELFYNEIAKKCNMEEEMRVQADRECEQSQSKKLKKFTVQMFSTQVRGRKAFAAKQKSRKFKKLLFKSRAIERRLKNKIKPSKLIKKATNILNNVK